MGGTPRSSILCWDFPRNRPSSSWGIKIYENLQILVYDSLWHLRASHMIDDAWLKVKQILDSIHGL